MSLPDIPMKARDWTMMTYEKWKERERYAKYREAIQKHDENKRKVAEAAKEEGAEEVETEPMPAIEIPPLELNVRKWAEHAT